MICAIYARVSTKEKNNCPVCGKLVRVFDEHLAKHSDRAYGPCAGAGRRIEDSAEKGQDTENQLVQLRKYAESQGWQLREFIDRETGKHSDRSALQELFAAASRREINVVLVWALDRFTREGVAETFLHIQKLASYGVQFESLTEAHFRTTGPAGELMIAVAAWIAKQERIRISDRTKAGLARARAQGRQCGRPIRIFRRDEAREMRENGKSWRQIARETGIPEATLRRNLKGAPKRSPRAA